jgi:hypothetical protein
MLILKTRPENLGRVVEAQKHALHGRLNNAQPGDLLLLAEIRPHGPALVRYGMRFKTQRRANPGETEAIWGQRWDFVIEGEGCRELNHRFDPQVEKVTSTNYGRGGTFVYVACEDAEAFRRKGLLAPLLT